jgi:hypothetical protein
VCCKKLSIEGLLREAQRVVATRPGSPNNDIALGDHQMAALTLFRLNYRSPLQFDHDREDAAVRANLKALYGIERAPRDTGLRERLDTVPPCQLRPVYTALFRSLLRGKRLEGLAYLYGPYLISRDGTGYLPRTPFITYPRPIALGHDPS